jgi:hypothetical protein
MAIRVDTERAQVSDTPKAADWTVARQTVGAVPMPTPKASRFDNVS